MILVLLLLLGGAGNALAAMRALDHGSRNDVLAGNDGQVSELG
jgi:hypothetical protein